MALMIVLAGACTKEVLSSSEGSVELSVAESKLIHSSVDGVSGQLLVYFDEEAVTTVENMPQTRAGVATRSGIDGLDDVLEGIGVVSVERLFPVNPKTEERTRAAGLHRWYKLKFDSSVDLNDAALAIAEYAEVSRVQFNCKVQRVDANVSNMVPVTVNRLSAVKSTSDVFNDPYLGSQWNYINTGDTDIYSKIIEGADARLEEAWKICAGDPRVIVAVVDEGIQYTHPDLAANMWVNTGEVDGNSEDDDDNGYADDIYGYNFIDGYGGVIMWDEDNYHGTHVAGTLAAVNNNGEGVCGVAGGTGNNDGIRLMSCQIFHGYDGGEVSTVAAAVKYAADNGASILQCSFGYSSGVYTSDNAYELANTAEYDALMYFMNTSNSDVIDGGLVIFAAGNEMNSMSAYPGAVEEFISVSAISCDYTPAYYTNYGYGCNISAPGGDAYQSLYDDLENYSAMILSTIPYSDYGLVQGTSMACPHVSGVAALGLSYALQLGKTFTLEEFTAMILGSVYGVDEFCTGSKYYYEYYWTPLLLSRYAGRMGSGGIDAYRMLMNVRGTTCIPVSNSGETVVDLKDYLGGATFELVSAEVSQDAMTSLGMSAQPTVSGSEMTVDCSKTGSGLVTLTLTYGTSSGAGINGLTVTEEFALVARASHSENGGWL